jgi:hypothetical protein
MQPWMYHCACIEQNSRKLGLIVTSIVYYH